jgi:hypothetical protein
VECKEVFRVEVVVRDGWREFPVFVSRSGVRVSDVGWLFRLLNDGCEQVDMDVSTVYRGVVERIVFRCPRRVVDSMGRKVFSDSLVEDYVSRVLVDDVRYDCSGGGCGGVSVRYRFGGEREVSFNISRFDVRLLSYVSIKVLVTLVGLLKLVRDEVGELNESVFNPFYVEYGFKPYSVHPHDVIRISGVRNMEVKPETLTERNKPFILNTIPVILTCCPGPRNLHPFIRYRNTGNELIVKGEYIQVGQYRETLYFIVEIMDTDNLFIPCQLLEHVIKTSVFMRTIPTILLSEYDWYTVNIRSDIYPGNIDEKIFWTISIFETSNKDIVRIDNNTKISHWGDGRKFLWKFLQ